MASAEDISAPRSSMMMARQGPLAIPGCSGGAGCTFAERRDLKMELAVDLILSQPARDRHSARHDSAKAAEYVRASRTSGDFTS